MKSRKGSERPPPSEVFTPRNSQVNDDMYVERPDLEKELVRALRSPKFIVIHGESGSGKTWLYKRILAEHGIFSYELNAAGLATNGFDQWLRGALADRGVDPQLVSREDTGKGGINVGVVSGGLDRTDGFATFVSGEYDLLLQDLSKGSTRTLSSTRAVLVIDNLEQILDSTVAVRRIAELIILADDHRYAKHGVKLVLVGASREIQALLMEAGRGETIANRLVELPEVASLSKEQAGRFVSRGFQDKLSIDVRMDFNRLLHEIERATHLIPQFLHDLCLSIAYCAEDAGWVIDTAVVETALSRYLRENLVDALSVVESHMNSDNTKIGRRSQTIYVAANGDKDWFTYSDIEDWLRETFPDSTKGKALNPIQILQRLEKGSKPLLLRKRLGSEYKFRNPKYRMAAMLSLGVSDDERVTRQVDVA